MAEGEREKPREEEYKIVRSDDTEAQKAAKDIHWLKKHPGNKRPGHRTHNTPGSSDNYGRRERHKR